MFRECANCYGTGVIFVDALSREIDVKLQECPACDGEGVIFVDDDDDDETAGEGDDHEND